MRKNVIWGMEESWICEAMMMQQTSFDLENLCIVRRHFFLYYCSYNSVISCNDLGLSACGPVYVHFPEERSAAP